MRTVLVWVLVATALVSTGCASAQQGILVASSRSGAPTQRRIPPADPAVTRQVCRQVTTVVAGGTSFFNSQVVALERAAAKGDQTAIVAAAEAINTRLAQMTVALAVAARKTVSPGLKAALNRGFAVLSEIASPSYAGATTDIARRLSDLATALQRVCR
jgi:hypothetical protein